MIELDSICLICRDTEDLASVCKRCNAAVCKDCTSSFLEYKLKSCPKCRLILRHHNKELDKIFKTLWTITRAFPISLSYFLFMTFLDTILSLKEESLRISFLRLCALLVLTLFAFIWYIIFIPFCWLTFFLVYVFLKFLD